MPAADAGLADKDFGGKCTTYSDAEEAEVDGRGDEAGCLSNLARMASYNQSSANNLSVPYN